LYELSERRACRIIGCVRMTVRYRSRRPRDTELRERLRALARERRRFGYRRLHVLLRREGFIVNHKRLFRLYREERLMARRRGGRKRALGTRAPLAVPQWPNDRWSLDFVADQFIDGRRLRILVVVDDCTRECLALVADTSISGIRVARELDRLLAERGKPKSIVSDNGIELTSNAILQWADDHKVNWHYIAPSDRSHVASNSRDHAMRTYDFAPLYRSTVGFDRMFSILDQLGGGEGSVPSYPHPEAMKPRAIPVASSGKVLEVQPNRFIRQASGRQRRLKRVPSSACCLQLRLRALYEN
jgi:putative transposase